MEKQFVQGMWFKKPDEKTPEWIKGKISVKVDEFIEYAKQHKDDRGWLNIDLKKAKTGTLYLELNTFKPKKKEDDFVYLDDDIKVDDLPF